MQTIKNVQNGFSVAIKSYNKNTQIIFYWSEPCFKSNTLVEQSVNLIENTILG